MPIVFRFCPLCAAPLESRAIPEEGPVRGVCRAPGCGYIHWGNSKATASAIVVDSEGRILFSLRAHDPFRGLWDIPGGFLESGEHPEQGVIREMLEETGLTVAVVRTVGVYMDTYGPPPSEDTLNFYYLCEVIRGVAQPNDDVVALEWFSVHALPDPIAFDNARAALSDYLRQAENQTS